MMLDQGNRTVVALTFFKGHRGILFRKSLNKSEEAAICQSRPIFPFDELLCSILQSHGGQQTNISQLLEVMNFFVNLKEMIPLIQLLIFKGRVSFGQILVLK